MTSNNYYMQIALDLARRQLGQTWPNPAVGAVVVHNKQIVGQAATGKGGRPHAETIALEQAGNAAKDATLYVSLEPCAHHGKTPPCVEAIIAAGITHCVVACGDPNPKVNGKGISRLRAADIKVTENICHDEARHINRGFISVIEKQRPYIAMKIATSADGKIASAPGICTRITSDKAREHTHLLRAEFDAILTGIGTALVDDPLLTVRVKGYEQRSPVRVLLDRQHRLPEQSRLKQTAGTTPLWVYDTSINEVIASLTEKGITRLLIEAGKSLNTAFLNSGLVDRLYWYKAPHTIGPQGLDVMQGGLDALEAITQKADSVETISINAEEVTVFDLPGHS